MILFLSPYTDPGLSRIMDAARALGWDIHRPQACRISNAVLEETKKEATLCGGRLWGEMLASQIGWTLFANKIDWVAKLPNMWSGRLVYHTQIKYARSVIVPKWMKPENFPGQIYKSGKELPSQKHFDDNDVIVSDILDIHSKYRAYIKNRRVATITCYEQNGKFVPKENWYYKIEQVIKFINNMLQDNTIECVPGSIIDAALLNNDKLAIIDIKSSWYTTEFYEGLDLAAVLSVMKDACQIKPSIKEIN